MIFPRPFFKKSSSPTTRRATNETSLTSVESAAMRQHVVDEERRTVFPRVAGAALWMTLRHGLAAALVPASRVLEG